MTRQLDDFKVQFNANRGIYQQLADEVCFAINDALSRAEIKVHSVTSRVKTLESFLEKIQRKQYSDPFAEMPDLVGVRVVCLFLSDLEKVEAIARREFQVITHENKLESADPSSFGYMSVHYECILGDTYSGPRYNKISNVRFELQCRTIVMDAWANISHHLSYKGEASVPSALKRDFHALSGLFYVADQHFELFMNEARGVQREAKELASVPDADSVELNSYTLAEFLNARYPDRGGVDLAKVSELVEELDAAGLRTTGDVKRLLEDAEDLVWRLEQDSTWHGGELHRVGVVRAALVIVGQNLEAPEYVMKVIQKFRDEYRTRRPA